ncbi:MAG: slipin family protein [Verrucomicrobiales bacterium]|nr:slipin family protein [Verrucomicrobiales bacterium]
MENIISIALVVAVIWMGRLIIGVVRSRIEIVTIWDYQVGLHFKDGRYVETLESGRHRLWGRGHSVILLDTRTTEMVVQGQEVITSDSATVKLTAVALWKVVDPLTFHLGVDNAHQALYTQVQLAMRRLIGGIELDVVVEGKADFGKALLNDVKETILEETGVEVLRIDIRDLMLSGELKASYAGVISARKEAQAQQERARGDAAALRTFANAARVYEHNPELFRLRYLETLKEAGSGYGNQLIIGVPEELMGLVKKANE